MNGPGLGRRQLLGFLGVTAAATALAACSTPAGSTPKVATRPASPTGATVQPTAATAKELPAATAASSSAKGVTTVTEMAIRGEWPKDEVITRWGIENNVKINFVGYDLVQMLAMTAAGDPPDMFRVQAPDIPVLLTKKIVKDLTPNFQQSSKIKLDDLAPANKSYWYNGLTPGAGRIHGMVKDWSPDLSLYVNKRIFGEAGLTVPSDDTVLTYQQLGDLAKQATSRQGKRTLVMGLGGSFQMWFDRVVEVQLNSEGKSLWPDDFGKVNLNTPEARDILRFWFNLNQEDVVHNPLDPSSAGAFGDFTGGELAICQYGYWYSGAINPTRTKDETILLPAPKWGSTREDPSITATGDVIHLHSKVADRAWDVFEWFHTGEPAMERAQSGWGVPALKSLYSQMPVQNDFQKQVSKVLQGELAVTDFSVRFNPYISQSENAAQNPILSAWQEGLQPALQGKLSFDQLVATVEEKVNAAIKQAMGQER